MKKATTVRELIGLTAANAETRGYPTVSAFLESDYALDVATACGEYVNVFSADAGGRVCRSFRGDYSVSEVRYVLKNLECMQRACDYWRGLTNNVNETLDETH